ncbi:sugar ABC transporter permease [Paenibacillus dendritiformis]|uniref:carbohydrate ABC transporter permease n=1 Tax=Paenibacillus TaxID=44249 RepID=UPI000DA790D3|nr:sugar ABC transporter permease [Paenibacillus dendritiformis]PZM66763.1 sugar ABC transporter permease [Paenibacillus dendritiformis]TDL48897.1 sugar ABC transporter permease [Paenibacillus dendritiformis]WGU92345.1 sugar ABC transporter permease [Paenibacillus dendritiformis]
MDNNSNIIGIRKRERKTLIIGLLFTSPWIIGFLVFQLYPIVTSFYYSMTEYNLFSSPTWVGMQNYRDLFHDDKFFLSMYNTLYITVFGVVPHMAFALGMALLLNMKIKGQSIYRTIYFLPTLVPAVAGSLLWLWILNSQYGLINMLLESIGIVGPNWLVDPDWTKPSLILMGFWGTGTITVMYLAALQDVPQIFYEAAEMDGASRWRKFWSITFPAISPMTLFQLIMMLIGSFQYFTEGMVFAEASQSIGGPENSLLFYSIYLYQQAFSFLNMGYAAAMAWILFLVVMTFTLLIFRTSARWVYYGGEK